MEQLKNAEKIREIFQKYKFVLLVICVGIILMLWPGKKSAENIEQNAIPAEVQSSTEAQLQTILSKIKGAGRVEVMLTTSRGEETVYQLDSDRSENQTREDTVIISDDQRSQNGLISQINPPVYQGAIVVCDGADDPAVRLSIVEAVSKATGLGASSISVLKMK